MLHQTKGVVLHRFKYSDSKVIAKIFTEKFGMQSYIMFGAGTKKGQMQINLLQPLSLLSMQVYHKENVEMQKIKELSVDHLLGSVSSDIVKNALSYFLAEFLLKTIKENEEDLLLFNFVRNSVVKLENSKGSVNNFHPVFLWKLTEYLGIKPENNFSDSNKIFDLRSGRFIVGNPLHKYFLNEVLSEQLNQVLQIPIEDSHILKISNSERRSLLNSAISFFNSHLDRPGELRTLKILSELFS